MSSSSSSSSLSKIFSGLLLLSVVSTTYLYAYPFFRGCAFPGPRSTSNSGGSHGFWRDFSDRIPLEFPLAGFLSSSSSSSSAAPGATNAPFRLLVLGDPQLEGDSSLPSSSDGYFPSLRTLVRALRAASSGWEVIEGFRCAVRDLVWFDVPRLIYSYRKRLDLLGNDYYLAHIYRTVHWFTKPTHVAVLGDLLGSQWVSDEEFERRGWRYWKRVFKHGHRVDDEITSSVRTEPLGGDKSWETRIINIAGNHDIGYAGDITVERLERFERVFGKANWEIRFIAPAELNEISYTTSSESALAVSKEISHVMLDEEAPARPDDQGSARLRDGAPASDVPATPELRIVVLNSLNLDTPALSHELQADTYKFINDVIGSSQPVEDRTTLTLLLTHLPLHKAAGVCSDSPFFDFYSEARGGGMKEQNHLSETAAKGILEGIFGLSGNSDGPGEGLGRNGVILTGHDHEGCDVYHFLRNSDAATSQSWEARSWDESGSFQNKSLPGKREITVRSMMGEFGGNAGLFSAWFDHDIGEWKTAYATCVLGTQHQWWAIHVVDSVTFGLFLALSLRQSWRIRRSGNDLHQRKISNFNRSNLTEKDMQDISAPVEPFRVTTSRTPHAHTSVLRADTTRRTLRNNS